MKILTSAQIKEADKYTIEHTPIESIELMERAAKEFVKAFKKEEENVKWVKVFCGPGNNGGDGFAISRLLKEDGYHVETFLLELGELSPDCRLNKRKLELRRDHNLHLISNVSDLPAFKIGDVVIDAIFGIGLNRKLEGLAAEVVKKLNDAPVTRYAVDIPSGMFAEEHNADETIFIADKTFTFQYPKFSFFIPDNFKFTGDFKVLDIGLLPQYIDMIDVKNFYLQANYIKGFLRKRLKSDHKGTFGHSLLIGGSYGKTGAIMLSARACLRSGAGLVSVFAPKCSMVPLQTAVPEAMVIPGDEEEVISGKPDLENYDSIGIGPGMGTGGSAEEVMEHVLSNFNKPMVIDADALNIIAKNKEMQEKIPSNSILTPHPKEFDRLAGESGNGYERLEKLREMSKRLNCIVLLKTAHTAIALPNGDVFFNSSGNPGLATAGTGDTLTGILTALLCQKYEPSKAAILGVYVHGLAADKAAERISLESIVAVDIIHHLTTAFERVKA